MTKEQTERSVREFIRGANSETLQRIKKSIEYREEKLRSYTATVESNLKRKLWKRWHASQQPKANNSNYPRS